MSRVTRRNVSASAEGGGRACRGLEKQMRMRRVHFAEL